MKDWVKQNWGATFAVILILSTAVFCVRSYQMRTAYAKNPAGQIVTGDPCGLADEHGKYTTQQVKCLIEVKDYEEVNAYIEQHCVAVLSPARDILMPHYNDGHLLGIEHVPEVTLKLRCSALAEGK